MRKISDIRDSYPPYKAKAENDIDTPAEHILLTLTNRQFHFCLPDTMSFKPSTVYFYLLLIWLHILIPICSGWPS